MEDKMLKCDVCKNMDWERLYCHALKHPIENGFAMKFHSQFCGDAFQPQNVKEKNNPIIKGQLSRE